MLVNEIKRKYFLLSKKSNKLIRMKLLILKRIAWMIFH